MGKIHDMDENCSVLDDSEEEFEPNNFDETFIFAIYMLLLVCGLLSNVLVCIVMARGKRLTKNFSNFHIFNLAVTEIVFRLVGSPFILYTDSVDGIRSNVSCKVTVFLDRTTLGVTFSLLAGIACDRYLNICRPLRSRSISWRHSAMAVMLTWVYAMSCSTPFLFSTQYGYPYQDTLPARYNTSCCEDEFSTDSLLNHITYNEEYKRVIANRGVCWGYPQLCSLPVHLFFHCWSSCQHMLLF